VQLQFSIGGRASTAEWVYDPRRRHVIPDDDQAVRLCLPPEEWAAVTFAERGRGAATVTPIGARQHVGYVDQPREQERRTAMATPRPREPDYVMPAEAAASGAPGSAVAAAAALTDGMTELAAETAATGASQAAEAGDGRGSAKKAASGRSRRASVPSWDEIMFGTSRDGRQD
jgi:hypothetical protein